MSIRGVLYFFRLLFSIYYTREVRVTKSRDFIYGSLHVLLMHSLSSRRIIYFFFFCS